MLAIDTDLSSATRFVLKNLIRYTIALLFWGEIFSHCQRLSRCSSTPEMVYPFSFGVMVLSRTINCSRERQSERIFCVCRVADTVWFFAGLTRVVRDSKIPAYEEFIALCSTFGVMFHVEVICFFARRSCPRSSLVSPFSTSDVNIGVNVAHHPPPPQPGPAVGHVVCGVGRAGAHAGLGFPLGGMIQILSVAGTELNTPSFTRNESVSRPE